MAPPSVFMQSVAGRPSMFPGSPIGPATDLNVQIPGLDPMQSGLAMMLIEPLLKQALGPGFVPAQFNQTHNLYDQYRRKAQYEAQQSVISGAAEADRSRVVSFLRGAAATSGRQWTESDNRWANMVAGDAMRFSPMLSQMMPDTFDAMFGSRGSAQVMAQGMFAGGRYQVDPVTGAFGLSAESATRMNNEVYDRLYGPGASLADMRGIGAGRAGQMYDEFSRRGLLPGALSRSDQLRGVAREELRGRGVTGAAAESQLGDVIDGLTKLGGGQLEGKIRQFEASRVADRLKNLSGAIAAVKDVFGEAGITNAPMSQLIEGLQVMTQGGLSRMTPQEVERTVRDASNMARTSGMGLDNLLSFTAGTAQMAGRVGLDRGIGVDIGIQSAAYGAAYGVTSGGRGDKERAQAVDAQLRTNAAKSQVANQLAATMRIANEDLFKKGSEGEALAAAIRRGDETYTFGGRTMSVAVDGGRWREIMANSGVDTGLASAYRRQTFQNQQTIKENGSQLVGLARRLQGQVDIAPEVARGYSAAARQAGLTDQNTISQIGRIASQGLMKDLSIEDLNDPAKVAQYIAGKMGGNVAADENMMKRLRIIADLGRGEFTQRLKIRKRTSGYEDGLDAIMKHRGDTARLAQQRIDQNSNDSRLQSALSGLGSGDALSRFMDAVGGATPETSAVDIAKKVLRWVPEDEVAAAVGKTVGEMREEMERYKTPDLVRKQAVGEMETAKRRRESIRDLQKEIDDNPGMDPVKRRAKEQLIARYKLQANQAERKAKSLADDYAGGDLGRLLTGKATKEEVANAALEKIRKMAPSLKDKIDQAPPDAAVTSKAGPDDPDSQVVKKDGPTTGIGSRMKGGPPPEMAGVSKDKAGLDPSAMSSREDMKGGPDDKAKTDPAKKPADNAQAQGITRIEGTLKIDMNTGTGRMQATRTG